MRSNSSFATAIHLIILLILVAGCAATGPTVLPEVLNPVCIEGTVTYLSPKDSALVRYPNATVTAWRSDTNKAVAETKTDVNGSYCIEVPLGGPQVDLRVWGMPYLKNATYICQGSESNIVLGAVSSKCGEECIKLDIVAKCTERLPRRGR